MSTIYNYCLIISLLDKIYSEVVKIKIEVKEINKCVNLHFIDDFGFKTNIIGIFIRTNLDRENCTKTALLAEVLKNYQDNYILQQKLNNMYGAVFDTSILKKGNEQIIFMYGDVINGMEENLSKKLLSLMLEILTLPLSDGKFEDDVVERAKKALEVKILTSEENKREYVLKKCLEKTCENEVFGVYGDGYTEDLQNINAKDLFEHYKKLLEQALIECVISGKGRLSDYKDIAKKYLNFERSVKQQKVEELPADAVEEIIKETKDVAQGKLCMSLRTETKMGNRDFYTLAVLNEILGGGSSSLLFSNIREKDGLCYYISSFVYRFKDIMIIEAGIDEKSLDSVITGVKDTLQNMCDGKTEETDFDTAKKSLIKGHKEMLAQQAQRIDYYFNGIISGIDADEDKFVKEIDNVKIEDLSRVAKKIKIDTIYFLCNGGE